jgi:hypothetical protein
MTPEEIKRFILDGAGKPFVAGTPLIAYHGTKATFTAFKTPAWFSDRFDYADNFSGPWGDGEKTFESRVLKVEIRLHNPVLTGDWDVIEGQANTPAWVEEMKALGHDGVIFVDADTLETEFCAFNPDQIRILDNTHRPYLEAVEQVEPAAPGMRG